MIIQKLTSIHMCDFCPPESPLEVQYRYQSCQECGREACHKHAKLITTFEHAVSCSGSGDAYYCADCLKKLEASNDPRLAAFKAIQSLRKEAKAFYEDYNRRSKEAEALVESLPPKFNN